MYVLGIFNGNNSSACLMKNGELLFASHEERYSRVKFIRKYPEDAIKDCLEYAEIDYNDIDLVAIGAWAYPSYDVIEDYHSTVSISKKKKSVRMYNSLKADSQYREEFFTKSARLFKNATLQSFDHHLSHAYTAFLPSKFNSSYVLTVDGRGDLQSSVVWKASIDKGLERVKTFSDMKSLGAFYGQITGFLGFTPDRHEGKITGLAAYGKHSRLVDKLFNMINFEDGDVRGSNDFNPFLKYDYAYIKKIAKGYSKEDVAFAAQYVLESIVIDIIKYYVPDGSNLCLSGGVFGNVKLNQRIREKTNVANYYVFPEMGDGGNSVGGALAASYESGVRRFNINSMYLGGECAWSNVDLSGYIVEKYISDSELIDRVADMLIAEKVIGLFSGRMEFGPRALGSRSILISACNNLINSSVNKRLNRTEFMPFAPVTLKKYAAGMYRDFSEKDQNIQYMTTCYNCTRRMQEISPAVVHIDGTARPQVIDECNSNELYYKILTTYYEKTGIPNLVNTSFNNHEEPIVCTPADALESLQKDNVDYIITNNLIISLR